MMEDRRRATPPWVFVGLAIVSVAAVVRFIDLSPRVEGEFFFAPDDPQMQTSSEIARRFPAPDQIIIRAEAPDIAGGAYVNAIGALTRELQAVQGIASVNSISNATPLDSPLWERLLFTPDGRATNLIAQIDSTDLEVLIPRVETVVEAARADGLTLQISGVPYVVELIRRNLFRDLVVFSLAAFLIFGALIALVYRSSRILVGTLASALTACAVTLSLAQLLGISIGLLTANIVTIVFVLTLSHIVFFTANWRQANRGELTGSTDDPVGTAIRVTREASLFSMLTTLSGFLSLLIASARPLRELGFAGAIGTVTAIVIAYTVYPAFLRGHLPLPTKAPPSSSRAWLPHRHATGWMLALGGIVVIAAIGIRRVNTDPSLLSYFAADDPIRRGLETIDRDGGSSSLTVVIRDRDGERIDTDEVNDKMWRLQEALERDASVGVVLSPAPLLGHAKRQPLAGFLNWTQLLNILESPRFGRVALSFVTPERDRALFFLRMREDARDRPRQDAVNRVRRAVNAAGLEVELVGGTYELQRQLGQLIASSLRTGLGGLLLLFLGVAALVSRGLRPTLAMVLCLSAIPLLVLGVMGHLDVSIDLIASPAANVALAMGVDSMIHLVVRTRRLASGRTRSEAFVAARDALWRPILAATVIISAGFGIFGFSTFPPTQRFGLLVILGTLTAATMALIALPFAAAAPLEET